MGLEALRRRLPAPRCLLHLPQEGCRPINPPRLVALDDAHRPHRREFPRCRRQQVVQVGAVAFTAPKASCASGCASPLTCLGGISHASSCPHTSLELTYRGLQQLHRRSGAGRQPYLGELPPSALRGLCGLRGLCEALLPGNSDSPNPKPVTRKLQATSNTSKGCTPCPEPQTLPDSTLDRQTTRNSGPGRMDGRSTPTAAFTEVPAKTELTA